MGTYTTAATIHGFLDNAGTITSIDYPGASGTYVFDINDHGKMVGTYYERHQ